MRQRANRYYLDLTPCAVRPSAPIMPPIRGMEMPGRVGEEVWGKVHAAVGDSCSRAMALLSGIGFRGFRGSVWRPRPGTTPPPRELHAGVTALVCKSAYYSMFLRI